MLLKKYNLGQEFTQCGNCRQDTKLDLRGSQWELLKISSYAILRFIDLSILSQIQFIGTKQRIKIYHLHFNF